MSLLTELFSNFWVALAAKLLFVAIFIPLIGIVLTYSEMEPAGSPEAAAPSDPENSVCRARRGGTRSVSWKTRPKRNCTSGPRN